MSESEAALNGDAILATYQPTEAAFELASSIDEDPTQKYKSGTAPYSYIEPSSHMLQIVRQEMAPFLSSAGVIGMVTSVSHGTFHSRPASLIVFSFSLRSGEHAFRFRNANIKINFSKHSSATSSEASPAVTKFAPRKIYGLPTVEGRKDTIGGELTLQVPAGPLTVGPTIKRERETDYEKQYRFKTVGNFWSSKMGNDWDIVYWDMRENKRTKEGIPDRLNVAVVVEAAGPFVASVEVAVDTPFANGFWSSPWKKSNPAVFLRGVTMGEQPRTSKLDELTQEEWKALIPYEGEWESRLTDQAVRVAPVQSLTLSKELEGRLASEETLRTDALPISAEILEEEESDDR
jgi:hypothetical protein